MDCNSVPVNPGRWELVLALAGVVTLLAHGHQPVAIRFEMLGFGCVPNGAGSGFGLSTTVGYFSL